MRIGVRMRIGAGLFLVAMVSVGVSGWAEDGVAADADPKAEQAKFQAMKSPVPYSERSVARGKMIYARMCTECHGIDGKAQIDVVANATNLTNPDKYFHGTTEGEIFRSLRDGAGIDMPPFAKQIQKEEDLWHLVNFVRSLWPEDKRPKVEADDESSSDDADGDGASSGGADNEPEQER